MKNTTSTFRILPRYFFMLLFVAFSMTCSMKINAQSPLYSTDFGTGIGGSTGWSTSQSNTWTVNSTNPSSGYTAASGGSNAATGSSGSERILTYSSVNTTGYANITVIWGARRNTTITLTFEWSTNGSTWIPLTFTDVTNDQTWALVNGGTRIVVPVANIPTLYFRWRMTNPGAGNYRIDDFSVQGTPVTLGTPCSGTPAPGNTIFTPAAVCNGVPFTASLQNVISNTGITYQWQSSLNNSTWTNISPVLISTNFSPQPANTNIYSTNAGDAAITGGVLRLTTATGSQLGGFVIETTPGSNITPFTATFDYRIYDGDGADGMSLSFGPDIAESPGGGEAGEGSGIIVMFDTYDNTGGTNPNSQIRINYAGSPVWNNTIGGFNLRNTAYRTIRLTVDNNGYLTLTIAGTMIVNSLLLPGYTAADKTNWKFKFSARTGGSDDMHSIDNLTIQMGDNPTYSTSETVSTYYRCNVTCATTPSTGTSTSAQAIVHPNPSASLFSQSNISCFNGNDGSITLSASGGTGPYQYSIYNGDVGTWQASNPTINSLSAGQYKIRVKDNFGCMSPAIP